MVPELPLPALGALPTPCLSFPTHTRGAMTLTPALGQVLETLHWNGKPVS